MGRIVLVIMIFLISVYFGWRIVAKTGNSGALVLLFLVPFVNIAMLAYFAFSEWPIERRLKAMNEKSSFDHGGPLR